ncbi:MAG: hypothetical protein MJ124_10090, partial [Lachnospiraceae bacterium]|nr:hypothetical protein [Lachnospiraceae bacterium]
AVTCSDTKFNYYYYDEFVCNDDSELYKAIDKQRGRDYMVFLCPTSEYSLDRITDTIVNVLEHDITYSYRSDFMDGYMMVYVMYYW